MVCDAEKHSSFFGLRLPSASGATSTRLALAVLSVSEQCCYRTSDLMNKGTDIA
jgi:hypothetical protein